MPRIGTGLGLGLFRAAAGGASFDADAQAFFDRVTTAGGTLSETEKDATNQLVLDMKSAGIWSSMIAIYPMVGASAAACAQNLKSSSFTGTFSSGWTFASTGVTPNGTSAYFDTTLNIGTTFTDNAAAWAYSRTASIPTTDSFIFGARPSSGGALSLDFYNGSRVFGLTQNTIDVNLGTNQGAGFFGLNRLNLSSVKIYKNGSSVGSNTNTVVALFGSRTLYFGAENAGAAQFYSNAQNAFGAISDGLTDTQASNFYTAVQAFQTTLGRAIAPS